MKTKIIQDFHSVSNAEMFLYRLQDRYIVFFQPKREDTITLLRRCIDWGLLSFERQAEWQGIVAQLNVCRDFQIQYSQYENKRKYNQYNFLFEENDLLRLSEHMGAYSKRGIMNLYTEHQIEMDIPVALHERARCYEQAKEILCP